MPEKNIQFHRPDRRNYGGIMVTTKNATIDEYRRSLPTTCTINTCAGRHFNVAHREEYLRRHIFRSPPVAACFCAGSPRTLSVDYAPSPAGCVCLSPG